MKQCGEERELESHTMHAYINQLAEHDVVACLHFFPSSLFFYRFSSCRSFAPSYISHSHSLRWGWKLSAEEAEKYITLGAHKKTRACVCGALYLKQHHVTYSMQCIHHFYVLAHMWCSAFFFISLIAIAESISNQFHSFSHPNFTRFSLSKCRS